MAILSAQLDKSGDSGRALVVVAGYIAGDLQWDNLGKEWKRALKDANVKDFNMSHFMTDGRRPECEFNDHDWPKKRKDQLMRVLARIVKDYTQQAVCGGVPRQAIQQANLGTAKKYIGDEYRLACFMAIHESTGWAKEAEALRERVDFVFDNDGKFYTPVTSAYALCSEDERLSHKFKIGNFAFSDRHCTVGIQVADMLAYLLMEYNRRKLKDSKAKVHPYLRALQQRSTQIRGKLFGKEDVEYWGRKFEKEIGSIPKAAFKGFNPIRKGGHKCPEK